MTYQEQYELLCEAYKMRTPEKPREYKDMYNHTRYSCPNCVRNEILYAGQKFCSVCGKGIKWE